MLYRKNIIFKSIAIILIQAFLALDATNAPRTGSPAGTVTHLAPRLAIITRDFQDILGATVDSYIRTPALSPTKEEIERPNRGYAWRERAVFIAGTVSAALGAGIALALGKVDIAIVWTIVTSFLMYLGKVSRDGSDAGRQENSREMTRRGFGAVVGKIAVLSAFATFGSAIQPDNVRAQRGFFKEPKNFFVDLEGEISDEYLRRYVDVIESLGMISDTSRQKAPEIPQLEVMKGSLGTSMLLHVHEEGTLDAEQQLRDLNALLGRNGLKRFHMVEAEGVWSQTLTYRTISEFAQKLAHEIGRTGLGYLDDAAFLRMAEAITYSESRFLHFERRSRDGKLVPKSSPTQAVGATQLIVGQSVNEITRLVFRHKGGMLRHVEHITAARGLQSEFMARYGKEKDDQGRRKAIEQLYAKMHGLADLTGVNFYYVLALWHYYGNPREQLAAIVEIGRMAEEMGVEKRVDKGAYAPANIESALIECRRDLLRQEMLFQMIDKEMIRSLYERYKGDNEKVKRKRISVFYKYLAKRVREDKVFNQRVGYFYLWLMYDRASRLQLVKDGDGFELAERMPEYFKNNPQGFDPFLAAAAAYNGGWEVVREALESFGETPDGAGVPLWLQHIIGRERYRREPVNYLRMLLEFQHQYGAGLSAEHYAILNRLTEERYRRLVITNGSLWDTGEPVSVNGVMRYAEHQRNDSFDHTLAARLAMVLGSEYVDSFIRSWGIGQWTNRIMTNDMFDMVADRLTSSDRRFNAAAEAVLSYLEKNRQADIAAIMKEKAEQLGERRQGGRRDRQSDTVSTREYDEPTLAEGHALLSAVKWLGGLTVATGMLAAVFTRFSRRREDVAKLDPRAPSARYPRPRSLRERIKRVFGFFSVSMLMLHFVPGLMQIAYATTGAPSVQTDMVSGGIIVTALAIVIGAVISSAIAPTQAGTQSDTSRVHKFIQENLGFLETYRSDEELKGILTTLTDRAIKEAEAEKTDVLTAMRTLKYYGDDRILLRAWAFAIEFITRPDNRDLFDKIKYHDGIHWNGLLIVIDKLAPVFEAQKLFRDQERITRLLRLAIYMHDLGYFYLDEGKAPIARDHEERSKQKAIEFMRQHYSHESVDIDLQIVLYLIDKTRMKIGDEFKREITSENEVYLALEQFEEAPSSIAEKSQLQTDIENMLGIDGINIDKKDERDIVLDAIWAGKIMVIADLMGLDAVAFAETESIYPETIPLLSREFREDKNRGGNAPAASTYLGQIAESPMFFSWVESNRLVYVYDNPEYLSLSFKKYFEIEQEQNGEASLLSRQARMRQRLANLRDSIEQLRSGKAYDGRLLDMTHSDLPIELATLPPVALLRGFVEQAQEKGVYTPSFAAELFTDIRRIINEGIEKRRQEEIAPAIAPQAIPGSRASIDQSI